MKRLILSVITAGLMFAAQAQVPGTLSYQGILVDGTGVPVTDGTHYLQFRFYDAPTAGTLKYSSLGPGTGNNVTTYKGMFTFIIGSGSAGNAAIPTPDIMWDSQLYIEITADNVVLAPRVQLTTTAYSFKSESANGVVDDAITSAKILDGTIAAGDLGTGAVTSVKILDGTIAAVDLANDAVTSAKILDATVATADLANASVTSAKLAPGAVSGGTAGTITDASITSADLAAGSVSGGAAGTITDASITSVDLAAGSVSGGTAGTITDASITSADLAAGSVSGGTAGTITDASITSADLANDAVTSAKILDGTISSADLANSAISGGAGGAITDGSIVAADLNAMGASNGQLLQYNSGWAPAGISSVLTNTMTANATISSGGFNLLFNGAGKMGIGLGAGTPASKLDVGGSVTIGNTYAGTNAAPTNGAIIEGNVGIGTTSVLNKLDVEGALAVGAAYAGSNAAPANGALFQGNVAIGTTLTTYPLAVSSTAAATNTFILQGYAGASTQNGLAIDMTSATGTGAKYGIYNLLNGTSGSGSPVYGFSSTMIPNGSGTAFGLANVITGVGTGVRYGAYNSLSLNASNTSNHFGTYNTLTNTTGGGSGGLFGTANVVNTTAAGAVIPSGTRVGSYNYVNENSSVYSGIGTYNYSLHNGTGSLFGSYNYVNHASTGTTYGIYADVNKAASQAGTLYGLFIVSDNDGTGDSYLMYSSSVGSTTGTEYGLYITGEDVNYFSSKVGMGTSSLVTIGSDRLYVNGTVRASAYNTISDRRFKTNFQLLSGSLDKLMSINGLSFNWRVDEFKDRDFSSERQVGFIAQEVEKVLPELVSTSTDGYKAVNYSAMTAVLVEAVKEQQTQIEELKSSLVEMQTKLNQFQSLSAEVEALKKMITANGSPAETKTSASGKDK